MENPNGVLAAVYAVMNEISQGNELQPGVTTDVRAFAAEIACEAVSLSDEEVLPAAADLDEQMKNVNPKPRPLRDEYQRWLDEPPAVLNGDFRRVTKFALHQVRLGIASRRFFSTFAERFPERSSQPEYRRSADYLQGNVLTFRIVVEYFAQQQRLAAEHDVA